MEKKNKRFSRSYFFLVLKSRNALNTKEVGKQVRRKNSTTTGKTSTSWYNRTQSTPPPDPNVLYSKLD